MAPSGARAACSPAVTLEGDPQLGAIIGRELKARGVAEEPVAGCPTAIVRLERSAGRVTVTIVELVNQREQRAFANEDMAAAYIESWSRRDISGPLLAVPPGALDGPRPAPVAAAPVAAAPVLAANPGPAPASRVSLALHGGMSMSVDRAGKVAGWGGVGLSACAHTGPVCIGGRLALRTATPALYTDTTTTVYGPRVARLPLTSRTDLETILMVDVPVTRRRVQVTPGAGLGMGWLLGRYDDNGSPTRLDQGGVRARGHLGVSVPLRYGLAADLDLGATVFFLTNDEPHPLRVDPPPQLCATMPMAPICMPPVLPTGDNVLAPILYLDLSIGLRWSGP